MPQTLGSFIKGVNIKFPNTFPDWQKISSRLTVPHIPTGALMLDHATGIGGFPRGAITEVFGPESVGKGTIVLESCRECQEGVPKLIDLSMCDPTVLEKLGVLYIDFENAFDPVYAQKLGVNLDPELFGLTQPNSLEDGMRIAESATLNVRNLGLVVADSVAAMSPEAEQDAEIGDIQPGLQARAVSAALRKLKGQIKKSGVAWVFINQLRSVIDLSWSPGKKNAAKQVTTSGGRALKFYADMRVELVAGGVDTIKESSIFSKYERNRPVAFHSRATIVKNKFGVPYREAHLLLRAGEGFDSLPAVMEVAHVAGLIGHTGAYWYLPQPFCDPDLQQTTIQGEENAVTFFKEHPQQLGLLVDKVKEFLYKVDAI